MSLILMLHFHNNKKKNIDLFKVVTESKVYLILNATFQIQFNWERLRAKMKTVFCKEVDKE